jgi:hypothetical protein
MAGAGASNRMPGSPARAWSRILRWPPDAGSGFRAGKLGEQNGGLEFGQAQVAAEHAVIVPGGPLQPAAVGVTAAEIGQGFVVGDQNTAFARGDVLRDLETERAAVAERAGAAAVPLAAPGVGGVFEHAQTVLCARALIRSMSAIYPPRAPG